MTGKSYWNFWEGWNSGLWTSCFSGNDSRTFKVHGSSFVCYSEKATPSGSIILATEESPVPSLHWLSYAPIASRWKRSFFQAIMRWFASPEKIGLP